MQRTRIRFWPVATKHLIVVTTITVLARSIEATAQICPGDCNGDRTVTVDEIVTCVNIALGTQPTSACPEGDVNGDGSIAVDDLVRSVTSALSGCPLARLLVNTNPSDPLLAEIRLAGGVTAFLFGRRGTDGLPTSLRTISITTPGEERPVLFRFDEANRLVAITGIDNFTGVRIRWLDGRFVYVQTKEESRLLKLPDEPPDGEPETISRTQFPLFTGAAKRPRDSSPAKAEGILSFESCGWPFPDLAFPNLWIHGTVRSDHGSFELYTDDFQPGGYLFTYTVPLPNPDLPLSGACRAALTLGEAVTCNNLIKAIIRVIDKVCPECMLADAALQALCLYISEYLDKDIDCDDVEARINRALAGDFQITIQAEYRDKEGRWIGARPLSPQPVNVPSGKLLIPEVILDFPDHRLSRLSITPHEAWSECGPVGISFPSEAYCPEGMAGRVSVECTAMNTASGETWQDIATFNDIGYANCFSSWLFVPAGEQMLVTALVRDERGQVLATGLDAYRNDKAPCSPSPTATPIPPTDTPTQTPVVTPVGSRRPTPTFPPTRTPVAISVCGPYVVNSTPFFCNLSVPTTLPQDCARVLPEQTRFSFDLSFCASDAEGDISQACVAWCNRDTQGPSRCVGVSDLGTLHWQCQPVDFPAGQIANECRSIKFITSYPDPGSYNLLFRLRDAAGHELKAFNEELGRETIIASTAATIVSRNITGSTLTIGDSAPDPWVGLPGTIELKDLGLQTIALFAPPGMPWAELGVDADAILHPVSWVVGAPYRVGAGGMSPRRNSSSFIAIKDFGTPNQKVWINAAIRFEDPIAGSTIEWQTRFFSGLPQNRAETRFLRIGSVFQNGPFAQARTAGQFGFQLRYRCDSQ